MPNQGIFSDHKWFIGSYIIVVCHLINDNFIILGKDKLMSNTYDMFGGRTDKKHLGDIRNTASIELMEETAGLIKVNPKYFMKKMSIDFPINSYVPKNVPIDKQSWGRSYCIHLSNIDQDDFNHNYQLIRKRVKTPSFFLEKSKLAYFRISDVVDALHKQIQEKGNIIHGIKIRKYNPWNKKYEGHEEVINRRTTLVLYKHLQIGNINKVLNTQILDKNTKKQINNETGFLKNTYFYEIM